jgi:hypothetical protein
VTLHIAVRDERAGLRGVIFDFIGGVKTDAFLFLTAWENGRFDTVSYTNLTFVRFLYGESDANDWLHPPEVPRHEVIHKNEVKK